MAAPALADVLKDFGSAVLFEKSVHTAEPAPPQAPVAVPAQPESLIDEAVQRALAEARAGFEAEHEAKIEALQEAHRHEIERLETEIGEKSGDLIVARFEQMEQRLVELTSSAVARILGAALTEDIQEKALQTLSAEIANAVRDRESVRVRVHGPLSLFESLQARLGGNADRVEYTETGDIDLTVAIDDALFETRLSDWSAALAEIMA
ncbi:MAG: hypothetical protein JJ864_08070 [Rhizobiaceae bacterium]|nr:hypothetical protein [Rhizobiaceae bacterium]